MLMEQRDELVNRSQELESSVAQLKAKDGQLLLSLLKMFRLQLYYCGEDAAVGGGAPCTFGAENT